MASMVAPYVTTTASAPVPSPTVGAGFSLANYPDCAQACSRDVFATTESCSSVNATCLCELPFASVVAACEEITCDASDIQKIEMLRQQVCGDLQGISSAIVSATASAAAAVQSRDPTVPEDYPPCAEECINTGVPASGCGSLSNRSCICHTSNFHTNDRLCEAAACNLADREITTYLFQELCEPVGGYGNVSIPPIGPYANTSLPTNATTNSSSTSSFPPTPTTLTGLAPRVSNPIVIWLSLLSLVVPLSVAINLFL